MLRLMLDKLSERKQRIANAVSGKQPDRGGNNIVSDEVLFRNMGRKIKHTKGALDGN